MAVLDRTKFSESEIISPAAHAAAITPDDSNDLIAVTRSIYIGGTGNLKVTMIGGEDVIFSAIPAGSTLSIRAVRVFATGTTATLITTMW